MTAVGAGANGELRIPLDEHGDAARLRQGRERGDDFLVFAGVAARCAQKQAGDVPSAKRGLQRGRESGGVGDRRRDEIKARRLCRHGA